LNFLPIVASARVNSRNPPSPGNRPKPRAQHDDGTQDCISGQVWQCLIKPMLGERAADDTGIECHVSTVA
jgi:hypothetical protein